MASRMMRRTKAIGFFLYPPLLCFLRCAYIGVPFGAFLHVVAALRLITGDRKIRRRIQPHGGFIAPIPVGPTILAIPEKRRRKRLTTTAAAAYDAYGRCGRLLQGNTGTQPTPRFPWAMVQPSPVGFRREKSEYHTA